MQISQKTYSLKAVREALYWTKSEVTPEFEEKNGFWLINFDINDEKERVQAEKSFLKKLNDFELRNMISEETKNIKQLVFSKMIYPHLIKVSTKDSNEDPIELLNSKK